MEIPLYSFLTHLNFFLIFAYILCTLTYSLYHCAEYLPPRPRPYPNLLPLSCCVCEVNEFLCLRSFLDCPCPREYPWYVDPICVGVVDCVDWSRCWFRLRLRPAAKWKIWKRIRELCLFWPLISVWKIGRCWCWWMWRVLAMDWGDGVNRHENCRIW